MSLPPGFMDELRNRLSMTQVVGRKVLWDTRKSNQGKGDMWAPCPFHQEKTASFHVDDRKGFYYCFGCHAKGDAISFVRETENVGFMEAVEILAREAGMTMPERDPAARQKADRRSLLAEVMERAVQHYRLMLKTGAGVAAREYLAGRGLKEAALERWEIGFAPGGWQGLWDHLRGAGVAEDLILGAGLAKPSTSGRAPYDTFRDRIMFPIRDARGRAIAFGGRAMDPSDGAKYLNSPETDLFDKGRSLYNHGPAREAAGKGHPLIVAEGYMDVIALSEAGFPATVAPLGTAVTEDQLRLLWRIADEPLIALDGDTAGLRAAMRVIDNALPLLEAGKSLRFALMPEGQDPDDLLRAAGPRAVKEVLATSVPMIDLLWQREIEGKQIDTPERRAAVEASLDRAIERIADTTIRRNYKDAIWNLKRSHFGRTRRGFADAVFAGSAQVPISNVKNSYLAKHEGSVEVTRYVREAAILALGISCPEAVSEVAADLERIEFEGPFHDRVSKALIEEADGCVGVPSRLRRNVEIAVSIDAVEKLFAYSHVRLVLKILQPNNPDAARRALKEEIAKLSTSKGLEREVREAILDMEDEVDEGTTWRLSQAVAAKIDAHSGSDDDTAEYQIAPNGARLAKEELKRAEALRANIKFEKKHRS